MEDDIPPRNPICYKKVICSRLPVGSNVVYYLAADWALNKIYPFLYLALVYSSYIIDTCLILKN